MTGGLEGVRVLDRTSRLAGSYAGKLLADAGADVVTVEDEAGHPLRRWTASGSLLRPGEDGALFRWLHGGRRSVVGSVPEAAADVVLVDDGRSVEGCVCVSFTDLGESGPWVGRPASDLTLQAESGSIASRGVPELPPVAAGGRLAEWTAGVFAAAAAVAALRAGRPEHVEVSLLECMLVTLNMHEPLHAALAGSDDYLRWIQVPSVEPTKDGWVCFSLVTGQQWLDFCALIDRPDLAEDPTMGNMLGRWPRRAEVYAAMDPWLRSRTVDEVVELAAAFRLPVAHVSDGSTVATMQHFVERGVFQPSPHGGYPQPRPPFLATGMTFREPSPAPAVGAHTAEVTSEWEPRTSTDSRTSGRPLDGTRVVDLTAFWAGPSGTGYLAALGADVVKVEAVQRPDGIRFAGGQINTDDGWWDRSWVFQAANAGKRGITLDLTSDRGRELLHRLLADADVLLENYSPRVMEQFGLSYDELAARYPRLVVVRMPAFGLDGPWAERVGFALTMEALAGMATVTGHPDGRPTCPGGVLDPIAGMHAAYATLLALSARDRTGAGQLVEVPMIECALNVAAEPLLEHGAYGVVLGRTGNRGVGDVVQDVYACAGDDTWVAVTAADEPQRAALSAIAGDLAGDLPAFFATQQADDVVDRLLAVGVPAGVVRRPTVADRTPHLDARGFYEPHLHPTLGDVRYPVLPTRFASWSGPVHRAPAPTLGQHNDDVLGGELGLSAEELAQLRADRVIGERPLGL